MSVEILKLLYEYIKEDKIIDKEYIEKLIKIYVSNKKIEAYVKGVISKPCHFSDVYTICAYGVYSKKITIYPGMIQYFHEMNKIKYGHLFHGKEYKLFEILMFTKSILHELQHARQMKIIETEDGLQANILRFTFGCFSKAVLKEELEILKKDGKSRQEIIDISLNKMKLQTKNRNDNYQFSPAERLAEIGAYEEIIKVLHLIREGVPNLLEFMYANKWEAMLRGYDDPKIIHGTDAPTTYFIKKNTYESHLKNFSWYDKNITTCLKNVKGEFTLVERMRYGLPISNEERQKTHALLLSTNKYN